MEVPPVRWPTSYRQAAESMGSSSFSSSSSSLFTSTPQVVYPCFFIMGLLSIILPGLEWEKQRWLIAGVRFPWFIPWLSMTYTWKINKNYISCAGFQPSTVIESKGSFSVRKKTSGWNWSDMINTRAMRQSHMMIIQNVYCILKSTEKKTMPKYSSLFTHIFVISTSETFRPQLDDLTVFTMSQPSFCFFSSIASPAKPLTMRNF